MHNANAPDNRAAKDASNLSDPELPTPPIVIRTSPPLSLLLSFEEFREGSIEGYTVGRLPCVGDV